uniref:AH domain-containing protein n=1 Tax=Caenorhabditis tropicalis TaxID=1561998 RepID=A0A1I7U062_9PELO
MNSNEEQIDIRSNRRERSGSATSILSISSETTREPRKYSTMDLKTLLKTVENIDISAFDRRRLFNPRKQRSCHKRPEPMSEELRKRESSKNSREYTKRNRDEISTCRVLLNDLNAVSNRLKELLTDFSIPTVEKQFQSAVSDTESIIRKYFIGPNLKKEFGLPELEPLLKEYQDKATETMLFEHRPSSPNQHKVKLEELKEQFEKLTTDKDGLNSSKDKTNFASSKSRLNQRIVRENLKSACWDCWKDINTMTVQGEELQQHHDTLKQQVWEK